MHTLAYFYFITTQNSQLLQNIRKENRVAQHKTHKGKARFNITNIH